MKLCRDLNEQGAKYVVIGGFAVRAAGYDRRTMDIDLLVEPGADNEARVIEAVARLPDHAAAGSRRASSPSTSSFAWRTRSSSIS